ncbi:MAG: hypothetical protein ABWY66_06235, partial [Xanthobacteraceae bacterium]
SMLRRPLIRGVVMGVASTKQDNPASYSTGPAVPPMLVSNLAQNPHGRRADLAAHAFLTSRDRRLL